jgi:outer membrane beta-barrel protein
MDIIFKIFNIKYFALTKIKTKLITQKFYLYRAKKAQAFLVTLIFSLFLNHFSYSQSNTSDEILDEQSKIEVQNFKEKYWANGEEQDLSVVQNRTFKKEKRFQIGLLIGKTFGDPFLDITSVGFSTNYYFNEIFGIHLIFLKQIASSSNALKTFEETRNATANTNKPFSLIGAEVSASLLYGKLSVVGKKIIYYDLYLDGGVGSTKTESGSYPSIILGLGQRFFISNHYALRIDYHFLGYQETILEKVIPQKLGQPVASRFSQNHLISISFDFFFGSGKE